jgi:hypothetical protein
MTTQRICVSPDKGKYHHIGRSPAQNNTSNLSLFKHSNLTTNVPKMQRHKENVSQYHRHVIHRHEDLRETLQDKQSSISTKIMASKQKLTGNHRILK